MNVATQYRNNFPIVKIGLEATIYIWNIEIKKKFLSGLHADCNKQVEIQKDFLKLFQFSLD